MRAGRAIVAGARARRWTAVAAGLSAAAALTFWALPAAAHGGGGDARYRQDLPWSNASIRHAMGLGRSLGLRGRGQAAMRTLAGRSCLRGGLLGFDVDDRVAFDVDQTVTVTLTLAVDYQAQPVRLAYDRNGDAEGIVIVDLPATSEPIVEVAVTLERARFAGRGSFATDLALAAPFGRAVTVCDLRLSPMPSAPQHALGTLTVRLVDAAGGGPTAARVGLYDASGRMPLPGEQALPLRFFDQAVRQVAVRDGSPWPDANRWVFYVDGSYRARVPAGRYRLLAAKGLEYRLGRATVEVPAGGRAAVEVELTRWADQPRRGWYAGDAHIHIARRRRDNRAILAQMAAEDLHVANLLRIGNVQTTYFEQYAFGPDGQHAAGGRVLVAGQEDPTTGHRGHTLLLGLRRPLRQLDSYFLYHQRFAEAHREGAVAGYAHLPAAWFHVARGLALDVPFGIVDFVEVLQIGVLDVELWYPFLDLGYPMVPAAGSDYPYIDLPGTVRNYVRLDAPPSAEAWLDGLRAGRTFVTNGPLLELEVNGHGMGETLAVAPGTTLRIEASAAINPDLDRLANLELVVHGEVVASRAAAAGAERLTLSHSLRVEHGLWLALRATGTYRHEWNGVHAHSAPVYVTVGGARFWRREAVPDRVAAQRAHLDALLEQPIDPQDDLMFWRTAGDTAARWQAQRAAVARRVEQASARYDALLTELAAERAGRDEAAEPVDR